MKPRFVLGSVRLKKQKVEMVTIIVPSTTKYGLITLLYSSKLLHRSLYFNTFIDNSDNVMFAI
jgi:hypothetical protein